MNDPNKRIDVNLSSLLSLKAELLRKQEEVNKVKKKQNTTDRLSEFTPKRASNTTKSSSDKKSMKKKSAASNTPTERSDELKTATNTEEDTELLKKSKRVLEQKARLYDRMTASGGSVNSDDTCLVLFNQKQQVAAISERKPSVSSSDDDLNDSDDANDTYSDANGQWTEYTDCLGRTRKCLKEDLDFYRRKDVELAEVANSRNNINQDIDLPKLDNSKWFVDAKGMGSQDLPLYQTTIDDDAMSLISKSSKIGEMRMQWEQKEQENINRDQIHYQDVLFDEARTHGVGYYAFSADQTERTKQQQELEKERDHTLEAQRQREQVRLNREKIIAERVFAAKNRQRARLGLPPLEQEVDANTKEISTKSNTTESKKEKKQKKKEEKERKKKDKLEEKRQAGREQYLRPWDYGKSGAVVKTSVSGSDDASDEWQYKPEKPEPMTQEQWNEKKRTERIDEFAPFVEPETPASLNRFTTLKSKTFKRRNADEMTGNMFNEPIRNELDVKEFPEAEESIDEHTKRRRAEIAPPLTFDYYGPSSASKHSRSAARTSNTDISTSIEAGLRFLREQSDKNVIGTKQSWVTKADY